MKAPSFSKPFVWTVITLLAIFAAGVCLPLFSTVTMKCHGSHVLQVHQVGFALKLYADDNHGVMPKTLDALIPDYLADKNLLDQVELLTPGGVFDSLVFDRRFAGGSVHPSDSARWSALPVL